MALALFMTLTLVWVDLEGNVISTIAWGILTIGSIILWVYHEFPGHTKKDADLENQRQR